MEKLTVAMAFRARAYEALSSARDALLQTHSETAVSRAYYSCFFAVHSKLEVLKITASSHKQTGILFRKHFIATGLMDEKFSDIWTDLFKFRMDADYAPISDIDLEKAKNLVKQAEDLVETIFRI